MKNRRWFLLFILILNNSCSLLEPRYAPPVVKIPVKWQHTNPQLSVNLPQLRWWKQYKRPQLDDMIQKALRQNSQLQMSMANIELAQSQLDEVKLNWLPNLAVIAGYSQFPALGNPGRFAIGAPAYIINIFQQYKQQKSATALYKASIYVKDSVQLALIAQVATSYFILSSQEESLSLYLKLLKQEKSYLNIIESQYRHGLISEDRVDEVNSQVEQVISQIKLARHYITVSHNALRYLFNENPGQISLNQSFNTLNSDAVIPGNLPASVLNARPDIREAEAILRAAHADVGAVSASLLPSVSLGSYLGTSSVYGGVHLSQAMLTMPAIDLPIFAQIGAAKARYRIFCIQYIDTIRKALREVSNDLSAYMAFSLQLKHNTSAFMSEKRHCQLVAGRYKAGLVDEGQVLYCQIKLTEMALQLNQNKLEKILGSITLFQNLGGGYAAS